MDQNGYGNHVRILHAEGWGTLYGHMQSFAVGQGRSVKAGDLLGESDNKGHSTGPHLHFELRTSMLNGQTANNPIWFMLDYIVY
jgi:murein DD-endopeptidase MepM/ murein hydrolase activator NlpD